MAIKQNWDNSSALGLKGALENCSIDQRAGKKCKLAPARLTENQNQTENQNPVLLYSAEDEGK